MYNTDRVSLIFSIIRQMVGLKGLKLARSLEKSIFKLEAHHGRLQFTH